VYGIDPNERIIVEEQDNCKQGCPACSRVCPENAIIFPEFKSPAIAGGDDGGAGNLKIDLSLLFGGIGALQKAVAERDRELLQDGRAAVGMGAGIPKRLAHREEQPRDELDELVDQLDRLEL
jgi:ferredoxin